MLQEAMKHNIKKENENQKQRFQQMKNRYDRDGVEFIQDEMDLAQGEGGP